jgi:hypothetical protein
LSRSFQTLSLLLLVACGGASAPDAPEPGPAPAAAEPAERAAEGTRHDPPIETSEVSAGTWMCDMGTVHYTAPHAGECPVCGMQLTEKK